MRIQEFYEVWSNSGKFIGIANSQPEAVEKGKMFSAGGCSITFKKIDFETGKSLLPSDINQ